MHVLHVTDSIDPQAGGPPVVLYSLAGAHVLGGHGDASIASGWNDDRWEIIQDRWKDLPGADRVGLVRMQESGRDGGWLRKDTVHASLEAAQPDFIHMHGAWLPAAGHVASWARKNNVPYAVTPHGMLDIWAMQQSKWKKKLAMALVYRKLFKGAAFVHALNAHEKQIVGDFHFGSDIEIMPNGVFEAEIDQDADASVFRERFPEVGGDPFVLFLSRMHYKKGLDILAQAWVRVAREHGSLRLVVAGPRGDDSVDELHRLVGQAGLQDRVHEVGPIYSKEKLAAFRACACFCLPSRQEGFSIAITEALGLGVPVVISRDCNFPEVSENEAGIETSLDPADVAAGLEQMIRDPVRARALASNGRQMVRERYTWPKIASGFYELYSRYVK